MASSVSGTLGGIGKGIVFGGAALAAGGIAEIGSQLAESVKDAAAVQDIHAQLNAVLANTGKTSGVTAEQVEALAGKYSTLTKFSDDSILSAGAVMARFKDISSTTFPGAMTAAMNLAQTMGTDLPSAAQLLGKILEQPGTAMMRLRAAGVEVTPELDKMLKQMDATGNSAGAQAAILDALGKSIGGAAEAAGSTATGKMAIMDNMLEQMHETVGTALLPAIQTLETQGLALLEKPETQAAIQNIAQGLANFAQQAVTYIPQVIGWFQQVFSFLQNNHGVVVGILAALGVAVVAFAVTTIAALGPIDLTLLIVIGIMAAVGAAAYLLYQAWTTNFYGIRTTVETIFAAISKVFDAFKALFKGDWKTFTDDIRQAWDMVWTLFLQRITTAVGEITRAASTLAHGVVNTFTSINWGQVGHDIVQGVANGISAGASAIANAARNAAQNALNAAKNLLGIHSPSSVFAEVGQNMMLGMAGGIGTNAGAPASATIRAAGSAVAAVSGGGGAILPGGNARVEDLLWQILMKTADDKSIARSVRDAFLQVAR